MSDTRDDSDFSSALYLNNEKEREKARKSIKSREKSSIVSGSQLDASFRLIKGLIDTKNMIKDLFFKLGMTTIIGFAVVIAVSIILTFLLYLSLPVCDFSKIQCAQMSAVDAEGNPISTDVESSDSEEEEELPKKRERQNEFFWMSQIFDRMKKQNREITELLRGSIHDIISRVMRELDEKFKEQQIKTVSLYLNLKRTEGFEFSMPKHGGEKGKTRRSDHDPRVRQPDSYPTRKPGWFRPNGPPALMPDYLKHLFNLTFS